MVQSVITELIAAFIGGFIIGSYRVFILPFIKQHFTDKIKLKKLWQAEINFDSGNLQGVKLELNKLGNNVSGQIEFISGRHIGKKYPLQGHFRANILTFVYEPNDDVSTSQGTGTFQRLKDGELLSGQFAYFSQDSAMIKAVECHFKPI